MAAKHKKNVVADRWIAVIRDTLSQLQGDRTSQEVHAPILDQFIMQLVKGGGGRRLLEEQQTHQDDALCRTIAGRVRAYEENGYDDEEAELMGWSDSRFLVQRMMKKFMPLSV
jgi:hypothetical protein